jgi:hypothetical protein
MKPRSNEGGGNQLTRGIPSGLKVLAHASIHVGIAQRLQARANEPLLAFR